MARLWKPPVEEQSQHRLWKPDPQESNLYQTPYGGGEALSFLTGAANEPVSLLGGVTQMVAPEATKSAMDWWNTKLRKSEQANPFTTGAGEVTGTVAPYFMMPQVKAMQGLGFLGRAALGALGGGALGGIKYGSPRERFTHALEGALGGGVGANIAPIAKGAGGLATKGAGKLAKYFSKLPSAEEITVNIAEHVPNKLKVNAGNLYEKAFEEAEKAGANKAKIRSILSPKLLNKITKDTEEKAIIEKAFKTKSLKDVHKADKFLGKKMAELTRKEKIRGGLAEHDKISKKIIEKTKNHMRSGLEKAFESASPEAKESFKQANNTWKQYLDYEQNPIIKKYLKKSPTGKPGLTAEDFIKKASKNETFKSILAERHPEIEARMSRNNMKGNLGKLAAAAAIEEGARFLWK